MPGCSANECSNRSEQGYKLKVFPRDPERRKLWASKVKRLNWEPTDFSYLCEVHFDDDQWDSQGENGKRKLKKNAVPTLFGHSPLCMKRKPPLEWHLPLPEVSPQVAVSSSTVSFEVNGKYSYTWKIDNYSLCPQKNGEYIDSPPFTTENVGNSIWKILLFPKGRDENSKEYVSLSLNRCKADTIVDDVHDVDVKFAIVEPSGDIVRTFERKNVLFNRGALSGVDELIRINELEEIMGKWKEDILVLRCTIVNRKKLSCKGQTKIDADRCVYKWDVDIQKGVIHPKQKEFSVSHASLIQINLIPSDEYIKLSICKKDDGINFPKILSCRVSLMDVNGDEFLSRRAAYVFESEETNVVWEFPMVISVKHLLNSENNLLKNSVFTLICEFSSLKKREPIYVANLTCNNYSKKCNILRLRTDLEFMYDSELHSDIKLKVEGKIFHAHKCILAARSPVFAAMFSQDMLEILTDVINISNVEADQFELFLEYIYTAEVENMDYEVGSKLMIIADKYQVQGLLIHCSCILRLHLNIDNVYEVLTLADMTHYKPLKVFVFDYIAEHAKDILISFEWMKWAEKNVTLAAELMASIAINFEMIPKKQICDIHFPDNI